MNISFELAGELRTDEGKGASRRLRHAGRVPAILYGGKHAPRMLSLNHEKLVTLIGNEKFYSTIIGLKVGAEMQAAIVKDLQMHPAKNQVLHLDLQRVSADEKIRIHLPIHFKGESASPGVKSQGGVISHRLTDIEVSCLPKDLPEEIILDLSQMTLNQTKKISDIELPPGVTSTALIHNKDQVVVSIHSPRAEEPDAAVAATIAVASTAPAAVAEAKKDDAAKKDSGKKDAGKK
ncbi:MAG: 50S ribosomal protein L25/general stress protein Ctc [Gammaproteobacteria bacterium]|nr:50S ribosomal protein L25/general stress protein Ctc [Gammaproteobacteria bacterium]